jgi:hypothetical protein
MFNTTKWSSSGSSRWTFIRIGHSQHATRGRGNGHLRWCYECQMLYGARVWTRSMLPSTSTHHWRGIRPGRGLPCRPHCVCWQISDARRCSDALLQAKRGTMSSGGGSRSDAEQSLDQITEGIKPVRYLSWPSETVHSSGKRLRRTSGSPPDGTGLALREPDPRRPGCRL